MDGKTPSKVLQQALTSAASQYVDEREQALSKAYYNGKQETPELKAYRDSMGQPVHPPNLFKKQIDTVLGMEHKRRTDWMLVADDDEAEEVAEASNQLLNEVMRLHDVNHHASEAFKPMAIAGLGWMYIGRNTDPLGLEYDVHTVPASEIIWDRRSRRLDMEDCQFVIRRRFLDKDQAKALFPEHEKLIDRLFTRDENDWGPVIAGRRSEFDAYHTGIDGSTFADRLYTEGDRPTIAVFDMYYRAYERRNIIYMANGIRTEYDPDNMDHIDAINQGVAYTKKSRVSVMRNAWFIGPYLITDEVSPHPHRMFPYVIARGHQEEGTNVVFGIGRQMIAPQDAYNGAHIQQHALMEKVTVIIKKGALVGTGQTNEDVQVEAHKGDGLIEVSSVDDVKVVHHYEQIQHLGEMKRDAEQEMKSASGVSDSLSGESQAQRSGVALQTEVDQSTATLAEIYANYEFFRRMIGRVVMAHVVDDIGDDQREVNLKNESGQVSKTIILNNKAANDDNEDALANSLPKARMQMAVADIASSEGMRSQNMAMLQQNAAGAPDEIKPLIYRAMLELSNIPGRAELIQAMDKILGKAPDEESQKAMDEAAATEADEMNKLAKADLQADIDVKNAQAAKYQAEAENVGAEAVGPAGPDQEAANDAERQKKVSMINDARSAMAKRAIS